MLKYVLGEIKYIIKINLPPPFFFFFTSFNIAPREFNSTRVAHIIFLLDNTAPILIPGMSQGFFRASPGMSL